MNRPPRHGGSPHAPAARGGLSDPRSTGSAPPARRVLTDGRSTR